MTRLTRRAVLGSASALALAGPALAKVLGASRQVKARAAPLTAVRLAPSRYADAVAANRRFLLSLEPGRFLHNFHRSAGLPVQGERYGGWEARGVAGQTLGHYLSACALLHAQTGDPEVRARIVTLVAELARIQAAHGDGYVGGTIVDREGKELDGKIIFEELRRGEVRTGGFDVNGGWVPLYVWHKVHAGLIDACTLGNVPAARPVMLGMAGYLATIIEGLPEDKLQLLLAAEHGGLNDSYAETYALTGDARWLRMAERIRHRKVLDPLTAGQNNLPGLHANTQIPKLIGLARLHELTGEPRHAAAARFFHRTVLDHHSYVIGGNSDREHFGPPDTIAPFITERTCESCNTYNMLKLTRHLWSWQPDGALFDYYERAHLNHMLAHQHPQTGMFAYFVPLSSGAKRTWSTHDDSFWCCVGSGIESHAKHGDSIWWSSPGTLWVNLFIPSALDWPDEGWGARLATAYPFGQAVEVTLDRVPRGRATVALRIPGWSRGATLAVNGRPVPVAPDAGYARITRRWQVGDRIALTLPMSVRAEPTPDNPDMVAFLSGPVVLAADLGPASQAWEAMPPALVATEADPLRPIDAAQHRYAMPGAKPAALTLVPFFAQYDRRTAVYFPRFTPERWAAEEARYKEEAAARAALVRRTVDVIEMGEMQPERDHDFASNHSDLFSYAGRSARQLPWGEGNWMEVSLAVRPGANILSVLYWGEEVDKNFDVSVEGRRLANERRAMKPEKRFVSVAYPIPEGLTRDKQTVRVRFETRGTDAFVYEVRMVTPAAADT